MGKLLYVKKGEDRYSAFKLQQKLKEKEEKKKDSFLRPKKVYGRRVTPVRRRVRRRITRGRSALSVFAQISRRRR